MASEKGRYISKHRAKELVGEYPEEKKALFRNLRSKDSSELLHFLDSAYEIMSPQQRRAIFGDILDQLRLVAFPGESLIVELEKFRKLNDEG